MIIDTLDNFRQYLSVNPLFEKVAEFISQNDLAGMNEGKYPILGDNLFVTITTAQSKTPDKAVLEAHRVMADIQIPLSCPETYGYMPAQDMPEAEYDAEKDIVKTPGVIAESFVTCQPGMFAVFFPQDGHAPCIAMQPNIKKAIFKVKHQ
jgi:YhcH/YjgK/YiaL family protein